jgi:hypothetical protein
MCSALVVVQQPSERRASGPFVNTDHVIGSGSGPTFQLLLVNSEQVIDSIEKRSFTALYQTTSHRIRMAERTASVERKTSETSISCTISLDNEPGVKAQEIDVSTGIGFLDHVRLLFAVEATDSDTRPLDVHSVGQARWNVVEDAV